MPRTKKTTFGPRETQRIIARRKKWVDALRSGKFQQTTQLLHRDTVDESGQPITKHCCLGVADLICNLKQKKDRATLDTPHELKLGLSSSDHCRLWTANDDDGLNFNQIADMIEKLPIVKEV